ncbi:MAG: sigma-70 family RNA polymerase sigma factor [Leptospiraceae bacterium]|nr:sigma-70 family RNA polymerase sigma factor [Leptospiraceae bacterium]
MLFTSVSNKIDSERYFPKTNFPNKPVDRWKGWSGILGNEDWNYIFTESVYKYIFYSIFRKCAAMQFDALTCEEIALSVTGETVLAVKKFCQNPDREERRIRISLSAFVNTTMNRWFLNFITRFYSDKNIEHGQDVENISCESSDVETYALRTEILAEIFECIKHLSDKGKYIISGFFFEDKKLKTIALQMQLEPHKVVYIKEQAEKKIADCLKSKGFD